MLFVRDEFSLFYSNMGWDGCTRFLCLVDGVFLTRICEADEIVQSGGCGFGVVFACKVRICLFWDSMVVVVPECL